MSWCGRVCGWKLLKCFLVSHTADDLGSRVIYCYSGRATGIRLDSHRRLCSGHGDVNCSVEVLADFLLFDVRVLNVLRIS